MLDPFGLRIFSSMAIAVLVCSSNLALKREGRDGEKYSARVRFFQAREKTASPHMFGAQQTRACEQRKNESGLVRGIGINSSVSVRVE